MTKEQVLRLIKEYQDYSKTNYYPQGEEEINPEELEVHEAIAKSLREELEKHPEFFKDLDEVKVKEHIDNHFRQKKEEK
ncbi:MAG: hypothetical protein RR202_00865 [Bacteroidales bacterium]